jgi:dienelactone hydrolase
MILVATVLAGCSSLEPIEWTQRENVEFESLSFPGALWDPFMPPMDDGEPVTVSGMLTIPPTSEPVPAVVIMHGCTGPGSGESGWVRALEENGYATLLVRSFAARGIQGICAGEETVNLASILVDAYRARDALADHPYIDASAISVLGLSFGGRTALWTAMERFQRQYDGHEFAAHLALYPSTCYIELEDETNVAGGPIHILQGTADDWTPIEQCRSYIERLQAAGVDATLHAYQGARHGFDDETLPEQLPVSGLSPRSCSFEERDGMIVDSATGEVASIDSPCVEAGVTIGHDPAAREQAIEDVLSILRSTTGP